MRANRPTLADQADTLVAAGRVGEAHRLLTGPAAASDADALIRLAGWRLAGQLVRRDLAAARDLFGRAGALGHAGAAAIHAAFLASGTGGPADWPAALAVLHRHAAGNPAFRDELALIELMSLSPEGAPAAVPRAEPLSDRPRASRVQALLSPAECDFLAARAGPMLAPSVVIDPQTGRHFQNPVRTSDGMAFPYVEESPAIHALNRRIAAVTGTDVAQGEPLQVLRYRPGQQYRPHSDAVAGEANQRILTVLIYLNRDYEGGETRFVQTGLTYRGEPGDALAFWNVDEAGRPDPLAQHAGLPVTAGVKLLSTRWIRARPFAIPPPRPVLDL